MSSHTRPRAPRILPAPSPLDRPIAEPRDLLPDRDLPADGARIDARRGGPPPEVLAQMRRAAQIHEHLRMSGLRVSFELPAGGRPRVTLRGADGEALRTISALEASEIATGLAIP